LEGLELTPMRVLVTGSDGYIGQALVPMLERSGHEVVGLDSGLFRDCAFPGQPTAAPPMIWSDVRDIAADHLAGFEAVLHLAGLSNDPLGDLNPQVTYDINHAAAVRLARLAKARGVNRFVFASSCSNYGASSDGYLDETAPFNPVTPYAESKALVERDLRALADEEFSPTYLRAGTAYGMSAKLRADLVVNNIIGFAVTTGQVLIKSDGMPWRPLVHVEDIAAAYQAVLEAPREQVHDQAFNVGATAENYRVMRVAKLVEEVVPGAAITFAGGASPDKRNYRVNCDKLVRQVPGYRPRWTLRQGIEQIYAAYRDQGLTEEEFLGPRYLRLRHLKELMQDGAVDAELRWTMRPWLPEAVGITAA
jgi:nucleoside-diphosphate-sugar epimerase